jgi:hypothetical protein
MITKFYLLNLAMFLQTPPLPFSPPTQHTQDQSQPHQSSNNATNNDDRLRALVRSMHKLFILLERGRIA